MNITPVCVSQRKLQKQRRVTLCSIRNMLLASTEAQKWEFQLSFFFFFFLGMLSVVVRGTQFFFFQRKRKNGEGERLLWVVERL